MNDEFKDILDSKEISELQMFADRPVMFEAVKKVLLKPIEQGRMRPGKSHNPVLNYIWGLVGNSYSGQGMINNEALGADLRAKWEGLRLIVNGFKDLEKFKIEKVVEKDNINKAR